MKAAVIKLHSDAAGVTETLAADLQLPIIELPAFDSPEVDADYGYLLGFVDSTLTLRSSDPEFAGRLCVDFLDGKLQHRAQSFIKNQNIAKAVGVKGRFRPSVLDATAGLGKDAYLLASLGCEVSMLERSALIHALLADGLARREVYDAATTAILERMSLRLGEFLSLEPGAAQYDVVYLDPMFPERRKSAKVKKDMALMQQLLGHQADASDLLEHARRFAKKRVVVKRAKLSPQLGTVKPDIEFKGSSSRYDVYLSG